MNSSLTEHVDAHRSVRVCRVLGQLLVLRGETHNAEQETDPAKGPGIWVMPEALVLQLESVSRQVISETTPSGTEDAIVPLAGIGRCEEWLRKSQISYQDSSSMLFQIMKSNIYLVQHLVH